MLLVEFGNARVNIFQADRIRIPHRDRRDGGEAIAIEINNVYVRSAQGVAFLEDARAFVHKSVDAAIHDFRGGNFALRDLPASAPICELARQPPDRARRDASRHTCTSPRRFLAETAEFAQIIFGERLADAGLFQMAIFLADAPANVEAGEISGGERSHGHTEIGERFVHGLDARAFFNEEIALRVRTDRTCDCPTKPRQLPTSTPTLPRVFDSCMHVAITSLLVRLPRTISSRRITLAGLKKCVPMTELRACVAEAISSMSSVEVLLARIAPGLQTRSSSRNTSFLMAMPSKTASITRSTFEKPS